MRLPHIERIIVATDFSEGSDAALEHAVTLARALNASVNIVHVLDPTWVATGDADAHAERVDHALETRAQRLSSLGVICQTDSLEGHPPTEIARHAEKVGAGMVVVGTRRHRGIGHVLLGSVAERVAQHARCPVLAVPAREGTS